MAKPYLGYLGPIGSFTGEAARKYLGGNLELMEPYPHLGALMEAYLEKRVMMAIFPIENSIEGAVTLTLDLLKEKRVNIIDEVILSIRQNLLLLPGARIESLKRILSHPQGIAQCRNFLKDLSSSVEIQYTASTAEAAKRVKEEGNEEQGAIASFIAGEYYQLQLALAGIEDNKENQTRFVVLGEKQRDTSPHMKTSIIVSPKVNRPGILYQILKYFADYQIDLTRIESRPTKKALGEYIFFIDFIGSQEEDGIKRVLSLVKDCSSWLKVLGTYPKALE